MMKQTRPLAIWAILAMALALAGCESRTDQVDGGGVLLSITDFDGLPAQVSVNTATRRMTVPGS